MMAVAIDKTYCLKHYRQTFPNKGCDMCEQDRSIADLKVMRQELEDANIAGTFRCVELQDRIAELEQRWIPCSERLPKYGDHVLLVINGEVQNAVYIFDGVDNDSGIIDFWYHEDFGELPVREDDQWHPLPHPPIEVPE